MSLIEVRNLIKRYGDIAAVDDISFDAEAHRITAVVGPDGAGKTTIFRALCGLIEFGQGEIIIGGYNVVTQFEEIKPLLGYMPQNFSLYQDLSVEENLMFYAGLFGVTGKKFHEKKRRLYEFSGLGPFEDRRAGALSGGMKQKLALSCALIHDPQTLMLDEPTTGVDPLSRRQFWDILKDLRAGGSAIVVSTPYMDEVALADRAIFVYGGKKLSEGTPDDLVSRFVGHVYRADIESAAQTIELVNRIERLSARRFGSSLHIYTPADQPISHYAEQLRSAGIEPDKITEIKPELEDAFIQLMGN